MPNFIQRWWWKRHPAYIPADISHDELGDRVIKMIAKRTTYSLGEVILKVERVKKDSNYLLTRMGAAIVVAVDLGINFKITY
jgi:hypothetical protein